MKIGPIFFYLFLQFLCMSAMAQNEMPFDTINKDYRQTLLNYYTKQTPNAHAFAKAIKEKSVRKIFTEIMVRKSLLFTQEIQNGKYITHSKYTPLIQNIFQTIATANPQINFSDYKLLLSTEQYPEAYSIENGIVVIGLPLIINLENQYQLAFTMSHELAHQILNHSHNSMLQYIRDSKSKYNLGQIKAIGKQQYNRMGSLTLLYRKIVYEKAEERRHAEQLADSLGYVLFANAYPGYESEALSALKVFEAIYKPKDSLSLRDLESAFSSPGKPFNHEWLLSDMNGYNYREEVEFFNADSIRTHPDSEHRILLLKEKFKIEGAVVENTSYKELTKNANMEYIFNLYVLKQYGDVLYHTILALRNNDDSFYKKMRYNSLRQIQLARSTYTLNNILRNPGPDLPLDYNRFMYVIRNLKKNELENVVNSYKYL